MKIYPLLFIGIISAAYAQTPAPKPATGLPAPSNVTPGQLSEAAKGLANLDPNRVVATIGTEKMTASEFDNIVDGLPQQYQSQVRGPAKRQFMDQLVMIKLLAKQAVEMKLDQQPSTQQQLEFAKQNILANLAGKAIVDSTKVDDGALHKYYEENKTEYQQVTAHHILIRFKGSPVPLREGQKELSEEEALAKAQEVATKLKGGADFAALAQTESADTGSTAQGGALGGPFKKGQMVKPFEDAAFALPAGKISDPVKTQFGYHIIRVDKIETKTFDEARPDIEGKLKPQVAKKQIDEMSKNAGVKLDDNFFGPPAPPAGPPAITVSPSTQPKK